MEIDSKTILIENKKLVDEKNIDANVLARDSDKLAGEGKTPMYVSINRILRGIVAVETNVSMF